MLLTERTRINIQSTSDAESLLAYYQRNHNHLFPWEPLRDSSFLTLKNFLLMGEDSERSYSSGQGYKFLIRTHCDDAVIGVCNFSNVVRGVFQACFLGYSIDEKYQSQGYMFEVLSTLLEYMFKEIKLNRVMANYMPSNIASARLLEKLGFEKEGVAKSYLKISGRWEDHILTSKINDYSGFQV